MWQGLPASAARGPASRPGGRPWLAWALQLLRLRVVLAIVTAGIANTVGPALVRVVRGRGRRVEPGRAVLQREAETDELHLDLVDRLRTEVADVQQVGLAARDELTHGVDALALEAVVRTHGEVEVLDRHRVGGDGVRLLRRRTDLDPLGVHVQLAGETEQLDQRLAGRRDGVPRGDRRLRLDVQDQPVEVRALLDTRRLDLVGDPQHRRVDRVDRDAADLGACLLVLHRGHVAAAALDDELDLQLALAVQRGDVEVG